MYKSFAITISTKEDFSGDIQDWFTKWLKSMPYAYGVIELRQDGIRHAHAQVWLEEPQDKGIFTRPLRRNISKFCPESIIPHALKVKIGYSDNYVEYMKKEIVEKLIDNIPQGDLDRFYPSQEEQQGVLATQNAVDKKYHKLSELFKNNYYPLWGDTTEIPDMKYQVSKFLGKIMFKDKLYPVIADKRHRTQLQECLVAYVWELPDIKMFMTQDDYDSWLNHVQNTDF